VICCAYFFGRGGAKGLLLTVGSVCRVKRFITGSRNSRKEEKFETEVRKWLRQQTKDFYDAGFDALAKRCHEYINVSGGYVEK
jgi:hypothetical protein